MTAIIDGEVRLRSWIAIVATTLACLCTAASAEAVITLRSETGAQLAKFESLRCKQSAKNGFTGSDKYGAWRLTVRIQPFKGFGFYPLRYGAGPARFFAGNGSTTYSNTVEAEDDPLPVKNGGNIGFPGGRDKIGISFGTAFRVGNPSQYGSLFGLATCSY